MNYNDKNKKHSVEVPTLHQIVNFIVKYLSFIVEFKKNHTHVNLALMNVY